MRIQSFKQIRRAFTLIEILIVVVILGVLAAIVIPQFTDASNDAMTANLHSQLQTVRSQIEVYNVQNPATLFAPGAVGVEWDHLLLNDYLQSPPKNPFQNGASTVGNGKGPTGWAWADPMGRGTSIYAIDVDDDYFDGDGDGDPD